MGGRAGGEWGGLAPELVLLTTFYSDPLCAPHMVPQTCMAQGLLFLICLDFFWFLLA